VYSDASIEIVDLQTSTFRHLAVSDDALVHGRTNADQNENDSELLNMDTEKLMRRASGRKLFLPTIKRTTQAPEPVVGVAELCSDGTCVVLHADGTVRLLQLDYGSLMSDLEEWRRMLGMDEPDSMRTKC
jgi:hypothetical protein